MLGINNKPYRIWKPASEGAGFLYVCGDMDMKRMDT